MANPYASFDALYILSRADDQLNGVSETEMHFLAYLSCLLSLYKQWPVSGWGYNFYCTPYGFPFSKDFSDAIRFLLDISFFKLNSDYYSITNDAKQNLVELQNLEQNIQRVPLIEAACSAILSLPIGKIREALINEPSFSEKKKSGGTRSLLDDAALESLYEQFATLSEVIGIHVSDLMVPAVVWITYLSNAAQEEQVES